MQKSSEGVTEMRRCRDAEALGVEGVVIGKECPTPQPTRGSGNG